MKDGRALVWEHYGRAWHRCGNGPMRTGAARALANLIRDPISDDDDAHDTRLFELELAGEVADVNPDDFAALRPRTEVTLRGQLVYIHRRIDAQTIEVYDDSIVEYRIVAAPLNARHTGPGVP